MKYIVYLTINLVNGKIYIGVHQTNTEKFDGYIGCGVDIFRPATIKYPKTPFQCAVKKYGFDNFKRITLAIFEKEEDAYKLETALVNKIFVQRPDTYNLALGGKFHPDALQKKVYMYDLNGNYEKEFEGVNEAARAININAVNGSHISRAIKQGTAYYQHQWSYIKLPFMKKIKARKIKSFTVNNSKPIQMLDKNNKVVKLFKNLTECRKAGYTNANKVLSGERELCKGYTFKYVN